LSCFFFFSFYPQRHVQAHLAPAPHAGPMEHLLSLDLLHESRGKGSNSSPRCPLPYHPFCLPDPRFHQSRSYDPNSPITHRLDSEHSAWLSLRDMSIPDLKLPKTESEFTTFLRPSEQAFAASTAEAHDVVAEVQRVVKNQVSDIAFQIDRLADGVHRLLRYGEAADELANDVLSTAAEARHRAASRIRSKAATEALPLHEVLRAISYTNPPSTALLPQPGGAP
jgi:hypothetical protein